jgi:hypothetical protein
MNFKDPQRQEAMRDHLDANHTVLGFFPGPVSIFERRRGRGRDCLPPLTSAGRAPPRRLLARNDRQG